MLSPNFQNLVQLGPRTSEIRPPKGSRLNVGVKNPLNNQQLSLALCGCVEILSVVALGSTPTRGQHSPTGGLRHQGSQPLPQRGMGRKLAVLLHLDSLG